MSLMSPFDFGAIAVFAACWLGYATLVDRVKSIRERSVIAAMD